MKKEEYNNKFKIRRRMLIDKLIKLLDEDRDGLSIQNLIDNLKISRISIMPILSLLEGEKRVKIREIGSVKLYYLT